MNSDSNSTVSKKHTPQSKPKRTIGTWNKSGLVFLLMDATLSWAQELPVQLYLMHLLRSCTVSSHKNAYATSLEEWDIYEPLWCVCTRLLAHLRGFISHHFMLKLSCVYLMQTTSVAHRVMAVSYLHFTECHSCQFRALGVCGGLIWAKHTNEVLKEQQMKCEQAGIVFTK